VRASSYRGTGKAAPAASNWSSPVVLQSPASDRRWRGCRVCSRGRGRGEQRGERKRGVGRGGAHFKGASDGEGMERGGPIGVPHGEEVGKGHGGQHGGRAAMSRCRRTRAARRGRVRAQCGRSVATAADRWAQTHSAGQLHQLIGRPRRTMSSGCAGCLAGPGVDCRV
jgi:hypothetical protein